MNNDREPIDRCMEFIQDKMGIDERVMRIL